MKFALHAAVAALAIVSSANAALITYTDRAAFEAALASRTTETFTTPQALALGNTVYNGVTYTVTGTSVGGNGISGGVFNGDEFTTTSLDITFSSPKTGFGADFSGAATANGLNFTAGGATTTLSASLPAPGTGFFGFISNVPFTTVDFTSGPPSNELYSFDNLTYGSGVPEPTSLALFSGVAGFALRRRSR